MVKKTKKTKDVKKEMAVKRAKIQKQKDEFKAIVAELKKKPVEELLKIVSVQPLNHELRDFTATRQALDELGVKYSRSFKTPDEKK